MTLRSLSSYGWDYVPILLAVWPEAFQHWSLQVVEWGLVLVLKWGPLGELMVINIPWVHHLLFLAPTVSYSQTLPPQETLQDP